MGDSGSFSWPLGQPLSKGNQDAAWGPLMRRLSNGCCGKDSPGKAGSQHPHAKG